MTASTDKKLVACLYLWSFENITVSLLEFVISPTENYH